MGQGEKPKERDQNDSDFPNQPDLEKTSAKPCQPVRVIAFHGPEEEKKKRLASTGHGRKGDPHEGKRKKNRHEGKWGGGGIHGDEGRTPG